MKIIKYILLFVFNLFVDLSVLSRFQVFGYSLSLTIPLIVVLSIYNDEDENIVYYAIIQGLFQDIAFNGLLGVNTLIFYLISYYTYKSNYKKNYSMLYGSIAVFLGVISQQIIKLLADFMNSISAVNISVNFSLLSTILNIFSSLIIFIIIYVIGYHMRKTKIRKYI